MVLYGFDDKLSPVLRTQIAESSAFMKSVQLAEVSWRATKGVP
jgi:hypothetical protein